MKKLTILIIITLLSNCFLFKSDKKYFEVTAKSGLILRKGPGQNFEKIVTLPTKTTGKIIKFIGETTKIQGKTGRWIEVETDYLKGFIFSGFIIIHNNKDLVNDIKNEGSLVDSNGILHFIKSNKTQNELAELFLKSYQENEKNLKLQTKNILKNDQYSISLLSLIDEYSNYQSVIIYNRKSDTTSIPNFQNFHPTAFAENSKIISGLNYSCYECCAMPTDLVTFMAEDKVYAIASPLKDSEAFCGAEGEYYTDFSQLRITKSNDVIIHRISYECDYDQKCDSIEAEGGCKPTKVDSDNYILIARPFSNPNVSIFDAKTVTDELISEFINGRKPLINSELE